MLDFVKARLTGIMLICIITMGAYLAWDEIKISHLESKLSAEKLATEKVKTELAELKVSHLTLVANASNAALDAKNAFETQKTIAQEARQNETATNKRLETALRANSQRVRNDLPTFATGNTAEAGDNISACRGRAKALASLLDETLSVAEEATVGAEQCGTDLRTMQSAWPRQVTDKNEPKTQKDTRLEDNAIFGQISPNLLPETVIP